MESKQGERFNRALVRIPVILFSDKINPLDRLHYLFQKMEPRVLTQTTLFTWTTMNNLTSDLKVFIPCKFTRRFNWKVYAIISKGSQSVAGPSPTFPSFLPP